MRPVLLTAAALGALVASVAIAQTPPPPPGGPNGGPPPHEMDGGPDFHRGPGFMRGGRHMPPPSKAAFFRFTHGDDSVTVKCADDEPTKACTDAATAMLQAIRAVPPAR